MFTNLWLRFALVVSCIAVGLVPIALHTRRPEKHATSQVRRPHGNTHAKALAFAEHAVESGPNDGIEQARYEDKAYPNDVITFAQSRGAAAAFDQVKKMPGGKRTNWQAIGPDRAFVPAEVTYTGVANVVSGRITALAVSPACNADDCKIFAGAAGGGIWRADNALEPRLNWRPSGDGIPTNAIGSLIFDPTDPSGKTLYAGTGEANQSADSESGLGLFRSTDGGKSWTLVSGSAAVSAAAAIATIAIDPKDAAHIFIGTNSAVRGGTGVSGGYTFPIPGAPTPALYESVDGGATFTATLTLPLPPPLTVAGMAQIALDPQDSDTVYVSTFGAGVWRRSPRLDGDTAFHQVRGSTTSGSNAERASIALTTKGGHTRIYEARGAGATAADLSRADNADVPAAALLASGWVVLSSPTKGTPGYASYNFCDGQCWYDISLGTPPGRPDEVWLGGSMTYSEIFTAHPPSNGRAVQRSIDAGASFTDMTNDANSLGMHPDQHALAFAGAITFVGSDGGIMRTSGAYVDASSQCDSRGLSGADLVDCKAWLSAIPTQLFSLNEGLNTLQFNSFSINKHDPLNDIMGGTQDNGTWAFGGGKKSWFESVGGDGGQSGIDAFNPNARMHTYAGPQGDVNFHGTDTFGWDYTFDPVGGEAFSFYLPLINDPKVSGTWFLAGQHVWRTQDNGGAQAYLDLHCNEFTGDFTVQCGDWVKLGVPTLTGPFYGPDKPDRQHPNGNYVVAVTRAPSNADTLWAATRRGRVFVSTNASAPAASVTFARIDTPAQPGRFISGISVDAADANHAYVAFSGYSVSTPTAPGHVYDVHFSAGTAAWTDISHNIGDQPVTALALDDQTGDLFAATEFGVALLERGSTTWVPAAGSLPPAAVYNLDIDSGGRVLYAATHGRGGWKLALQ
jgi:hypothetical protein